jgi:predicted transposase YbfD/YdcC
MSILVNLQDTMKALEKGAPHNGYWYSISETLIIMVCGMLCRQQRIDDIHDWAKATPTQAFLEEQFGITKVPCRAQFYNILRCVNAESFNEGFTSWMRSVVQSVSSKTVSIDGKTVCGTDKLTDDGSVLHIASALVSELNLVIGSRECGTKTGEISAFRELIALLDVSGSVVVADALHCNQKSAEAVLKAGADYLFVVKDNQPTLKEDIELYIQNEEISSHRTMEKNGGRIETRTAYATCEVDWLNSPESFKVSCIGAMHREFEKNGEKSSEWHYYISSAPLSPQELMTHARLEWGVESMHWLLDVHFAEDKTRVWDMNVQKILNITRKITLNMVRMFKSENRHARTPLTSILKENLFDLDQFSNFIDFFRT